ncbi:uncharacterized protein LOC126262820 [Schistocerca nitens]|uniref:uncharacterized protein LOC126262820 n=1 Tax=Schistocerca nitens TaxID=7011 RepID=UPI002119B370|nr:uncharacterized protein LOC126262820 [Schistocerca nitens]
MSVRSLHRRVSGSGFAGQLTSAASSMGRHPGQGSEPNLIRKTAGSNPASATASVQFVYHPFNRQIARWCFLSPLLIPLQAAAVGRGGSPTPPGDSERFAMAAAFTVRRPGSCLTVALTAAMTCASADTVTSAAAAAAVAAAEMHISSTFWDHVCNESYCCLPKGNFRFEDYVNNLSE